MYTDVNGRITGFEFKFEEVIQNKNNEEVKRKMSIDYFENGNKLLTEIIGCCITDELLEKIQERLLEAVMINQTETVLLKADIEFLNRRLQMYLKRNLKKLEKFFLIICCII